MFQMLRRARGSNPVVGSSRNTATGSFTSAVAMESRWRCPPDNSLLRDLRLLNSPTLSSSSSADACVSYSAANRPIISCRLSWSKKLACCSCTPIIALTWRGLSDTLTPLTKASPESASRSPSMISIVVVLPAPFGPSIPNTSPGLTVNDIPSTATKSP